ncbi:hypothetical protein PIB30_084059, partial [Stylosanthes scabra]|nr:hypothetical protein [Stylosanthes scabra]
MPSTQCVRSSSSIKGTSSFRRKMASSSLRMLRSWELIPPSESWMCEGDDKKVIGEMEPFVKKEESSEEDPKEEEDSEEEEDPEEKIPASSSLPIDIDATEDYLRFNEDLERCPEPSPFRSNHASVPDSPEEVSDRQSDVLTLRVMILPEFGKHHNHVRVLRVPCFGSTIDA